MPMTEEAPAQQGILHDEVAEAVKEIVDHWGPTP
jgi:hypothetical protein